MDEIWRRNRDQDDGLSWQYFGSQTGVMRTFPGDLAFRGFPSFIGQGIGSASLFYFDRLYGVVISFWTRRHIIFIRILAYIHIE